MNERRRTLLFSGGYKIPTENGVYIESVEHKFYLTNDWDTANTANSIAVVTDAHKFRMALKGPSLLSMPISSNDGDPWEIYLSGTTNSGITDRTVAKTDYSGAVNTQLIIEKCQPSSGYAAGWCNAYTFPDGVTKGYLPALGELYLAYQNKSAINAALSACGGIALSNGSHWSSTFYGVNGSHHDCWMLYWSDGLVKYGGLVSSLYVRAFGAY